MNPAPRVAANIGAIIPGAVVHDGPSQELSARLVRIPIVIEEIGQCEAADHYRVPDHGAGPGQLIFIAVE